MQRLKLKSEFTRNVLTLMTGTTIAQAIPIAISPILTRIYTPEDFGIFALFIAISSIVGSIVNGRYELAIMLPKKDEDAINILVLGLIITSFISLLLLILIILFNDDLVIFNTGSSFFYWILESFDIFP
jgi:O-antigen/teichoic acid export membrane protein